MTTIYLVPSPKLNLKDPVPLATVVRSPVYIDAAVKG
jgi:hypothetical protein